MLCELCLCWCFPDWSLWQLFCWNKPGLQKEHTKTAWETIVTFKLTVIPSVWWTLPHIHVWSYCKWSPKRHQCVCDPTGSDDRSIGFDFACILAMSFLSASFSDATVRWQEKMVPGYENFSPKKCFKRSTAYCFFWNRCRDILTLSTYMCTVDMIVKSIC